MAELKLLTMLSYFSSLHRNAGGRHYLPSYTNVSILGKDYTVPTIYDRKAISYVYLLHAFELILMKCGRFSPEIFLANVFCPNFCWISDNVR